VTTRFGERLRFLGRGTATEAMYSLTLRRTSRIRSASDFAGRATLIILRAIERLLNKATPHRTSRFLLSGFGKPFLVATMAAEAWKLCARLPIDPEDVNPLIVSTFVE
jgi:hypothetical protein